MLASEWRPLESGATLTRSSPPATPIDGEATADLRRIRGDRPALDAGSAGRWATAALTGADLAAPALLPFEVTNIIRRHEVAKLITADQAVQAHADLLDLAIEHWPYELLASIVWQLRRNLTAYDASYVALAELLDATLVTLDRRIARAPDLRCPVTTP